MDQLRRRLVEVEVSVSLNVRLIGDGTVSTCTTRSGVLGHRGGGDTLKCAEMPG